MKKKETLTLTGLLTVIIVVCFFVFVLLPVLRKVKIIATHVVCGTNLKSMGTAMSVYANMYDGRFPQLPGTGPWSKELGFAYDLKEPDFTSTGIQNNVKRTISASWYLLIRHTDIKPETFLCPHAVMGKYFDTKEFTEFTGHNSNNLALTELWDFGPNPYNHINYAMHNPYGKHPADNSRSAAFAIAADMNPWFYKGEILPPGQNNQAPQIITLNTNEELKLGNATYHGTEGQNVLYADGHNSWEFRPDVSVRNDNIYTYWRIKTDEKPNELDQRVGQPPTGRSPENDAKDKDDSFLAI